MALRREHDKGRPAPGPSRNRRLWLPAALILPVIGGIGLAFYLPGRSQTTVVKPPGAEAGEEIALSLRDKLVGRWLRPDGGYVLTIRGIETDGRVDASYDNPQPIHVAKAQTRSRGGEISLYVELRDRNYPGSYYTLNYDAGKDQFVGVYHHLGLNQEFDVNFVRLR